MDQMMLIGLVLLVIGIADVALARFLIGPRIADPGQRRRVVGAVTLGGVLLALGGAAFVFGLIPAPGP